MTTGPLSTLRCTALAITLLTGLATSVPPEAGAVVILDSTWREEGGRKGREWQGFDAHIALAAEPQFRGVLALATDAESWGEASATWIGNDEKHAYLLTSAHIYDLPADKREYAVRTPDGRTVYPDRLWMHKAWNGDSDAREGYDLVILRLPMRLEGLGQPPELYVGDQEAGELITFVGYGMRGIGSTGEDERFHRGEAVAAAAQGIVDDWVDLVDPMPDEDEDAGGYIGVYMPREDGSEPEPDGGARVPATRLIGLLGAGDSGGSAWMKLRDNWVIVGVNASGSGIAGYGDYSWFTRVAPHQGWIRRIFTGAQFTE
ncbi:MAG: peptidase S1 [Alcaligenaceae bacterium]|nr:peptidase S1 [Alcaligenaceae bacterium]